MASAKRTLESLMRGRGMIAFRDLQRLLRELGFHLDRASGSHHIYQHPKATRPLNVQPVGKDAKPYQLRQLRDMIEEFGLSLEE